MDHPLPMTKEEIRDVIFQGNEICDRMMSGEVQPTIRELYRTMMFELNCKRRDAGIIIGGWLHHRKVAAEKVRSLIGHLTRK